MIHPPIDAAVRYYFELSHHNLCLTLYKPGAALWIVSGRFGVVTWRKEEGEEEGSITFVGNYLLTTSTLRITGGYLLHPELALFKFKRVETASGTNVWHYFMPLYYMSQVGAVCFAVLVAVGVLNETTFG